MAEARIPVDLFNPGQVFACLGLMEAADTLLGEAEGAFDWSDERDARFVLRAAGEANPLHEVIDFLARAEVVALLPEGSRHAEKGLKSKVDGEEIPFRFLPRGEPFPSPDEGRDKMPALLVAQGGELIVHHWAEPVGLSGRDNVKFWAGAGGYPGVSLLKDALVLMRDHWERAKEDPFDIGVEQSSSFRLDWRRDYVPIDIGFSLNEHGHIATVGYPLVEILGVLGLSHARPSIRSKLNYLYGVAGMGDGGQLLPPMFLRAALGGAPLPLPMRRFRMFLGWPGQEGQARCITHVEEEN